MKKICIATGGTGGHIYPALALAQIWKKEEPDTEVIFIGNDDRMEAQIIPAAGFPFFAVHAKGLAGSVVDKFKAVFATLKARKAAKKILEKEKPDLVIGFGGYVTAPAALAAKSLGIPFMLHEQNSIVGKANRLVARDAAGIVTCYQKAQDDLADPKTRLLGNPRASLCADLKKADEYLASFGLDPNKKTILIVMGSLGSSSVNQLMKDALGKVDPELQILYACGKDNEDALHAFDSFKNVKAVPFVDALRLYPSLEGMICRAGATTLAEVTACGIPSIIIPSPYVAENHQYYNALMLVEKNAAAMIEEKDFSADKLSKTIQETFMNEERRQTLQKNARALGKPRAAQDIIAYANEILKAHKGTVS